MANTAEFNNNSGKTVLVLNAMSKSSTSPKQGYEQTLKILTFEGGATTLESGKKSTLHLLADQTISNLLISNPATLSPLLAVGEGPDYLASGGWPKPNKPITVTTSDIDAITQALQFRQNIMASPSSKMAVAFQAALTKAQKEGTPDKMLADMATFFQGYSSFSKVTYPAYEAIESYLKTFALPWVQPNAASGSGQGATYYLYSAPDAGKKGANSEGKIQATKKSSSSGNADPTDHLSGYTVTLESNGSSVALSYSDGVFEDSDGGSISLSATYSYKGKFTGKIGDVKLWPILAGTVMGKQVIAVPLAPESKFAKWWSSLSFSKLFSYFMQGMGLWMALDFLKTKFSSKKESLEKDKAENKGEDPTQKQQKEADSKADKAGTEDASTSEAQGKSISGDERFEVPQTDSAIATQVNDVRSTSSDALTEIAKDNANGAIEETGNTLESIAEIENTPAINEAGENLNKAGEALQEGKIAEANENIQSANENLNTAVKELGDQISEEQKEAFNDEIEANKEAAEDAKETEEESENAENGDDSEGDLDPIIEE